MARISAGNSLESQWKEVDKAARINTGLQPVAWTGLRGRGSFKCFPATSWLDGRMLIPPAYAPAIVWLKA
jgi:hypothetical protein